MKVTAVTGEDFGAAATLEWEQGGGIDISFAGQPITLQITEDAAQIVKPGAVLVLTIAQH